MIRVESLTKRYAGFTALHGISFEVKRGEIVGFLGPNGAGKSTTMRILSSFLPATSGTATVAGFDVFRESRKARERIGYMPENVPLYNDMRVTEYLRYRASLKGVKGRRVREKVEDVKELCGLEEVGTKIIGALSKGYRQRVGLADALVHEPDLLILDEPTIGLDPNQIRQVRELIRNLGRHHTILISTHILSEVEMTCGRVMIINKGRIEASDTPAELRARLRSAGEIFLEVKVAQVDEVEATLRGLDQIGSVHREEVEGWTRFRMHAKGQEDPREELFRLASEKRWPVRELSLRRATLEDAFAEITAGEDA